MYYHGLMKGKANGAVQEEVRRLRLCGRNCEEIAHRLDLDLSQIQDCCRRLGLPLEGSCRLAGFTLEEEEWLQGAYRTYPSSMRCPQCGQVLIQPARGRYRKFCSDLCRSRYWNQKRKNLQENQTALRCQYCGGSFQSFGKGSLGRKFCSRSCYFASRYGRPVKRRIEVDGHA